MDNLLQTIREDDFVEYYLFPQIHSREEKQQEQFLQTVLAKANKVIQKHALNYLWHKDPIKLVPRTRLSHFLTHIEGKDESLPPHLYGVSHYGDNIEDEWFIVYLIQEITKEIPGVAARLYDSDGEFLLIEAADFLPAWANPETCENRVYIYEGNVHLVPVQSQNESIPDVEIEEALEQIWTQSISTKASSEIQNSIRNRLSIYPDNIKTNTHCATVFVPTPVAAILKLRPELISGAVQAFCNRDPIDMKACRIMKYFPPEQRVKTQIKFTKCLYAMLLHSKYLPEKKIGWNLPPPNSQDYKAHILGVKVACGFEILASQAKPSPDVDSDKGWARYLKSLMERGYFGNFLEGSKDYNRLLNEAKEYYMQHKDSMRYSPAIGREILDLLNNCEIDYESLKCEKLPSDDDDSWLNISPEDLDKMLQERYGQKKLFSVTDATEPTDFAQKVNSFLTHVSDIEGAEFPREDPPERPARGKKKGVTFSGNDNDESPKVNFDPDSFANALQNILNFSIPEDESWDLESQSDDMGEYENDDFVKEAELDESETKNKMQEYMEQMDMELASSTIGQSFEKQQKNGFDEDVESFRPVDIDINALKNILESYRSQLGDAGPSSNMLGPMGVHLEGGK